MSVNMLNLPVHCAVLTLVCHNVPCMSCVLYLCVRVCFLCVVSRYSEAWCATTTCVLYLCVCVPCVPCRVSCVLRGLVGQSESGVAPVQLLVLHLPQLLSALPSLPSATTTTGEQNWQKSIWPHNSESTLVLPAFCNFVTKSETGSRFFSGEELQVTLAPVQESRSPDHQLLKTPWQLS